MKRRLQEECISVNLPGSLQSGSQTRLHRAACLSRPRGAYPSPLRGSQMNNPTTTYTSQQQPRSTTQATSAILLGDFCIKQHTMFWWLRLHVFSKLILSSPPTTNMGCGTGKCYDNKFSPLGSVSWDLEPSDWGRMAGVHISAWQSTMGAGISQNSENKLHIVNSNHICVCVCVCV